MIYYRKLLLSLFSPLWVEWNRACARPHLQRWGSEDDPQESVLSSYLISPGIELRSPGFAGSIYPLGHLEGPCHRFFNS